MYILCLLFVAICWVSINFYSPLSWWILPVLYRLTAYKRFGCILRVCFWIMALILSEMKVVGYLCSGNLWMKIQTTWKLQLHHSSWHSVLNCAAFILDSAASMRCSGDHSKRSVILTLFSLQKITGTSFVYVLIMNELTWIFMQGLFMKAWCNSFILIRIKHAFKTSVMPKTCYFHTV